MTLPAIAHGDPMPPGPYSVGLTHGPNGDSRPYTIVCGDGRAIAGHVESRECAEAMCAALNRKVWTASRIVRLLGITIDND